MQDILDAARHYQDRVRKTGRAHYAAVDGANRGHLWLGVPVVVTSTVVATSIFATLNSNPHPGWKIAAGMVSLVAAVLAALQTFFQFAERSGKHRVAGARYGGIRRELEMFLLKYSQPGADPKAALEELTSINARLADLALECPDVPTKYYRAAVAQIENGKRAADPSIFSVNDRGHG